MPGYRLLLLDMQMSRAAATEDTVLIEANSTHVVALLLLMANLYKLALPAGHQLPRTAGRAFWLQLVDENLNIVGFVSHQLVVQVDDRVQPQQTVVAQVLNDFSAKFNLGLAFEIPIAA